LFLVVENVLRGQGAGERQKRRQRFQDHFSDLTSLQAYAKKGPARGQVLEKIGYHLKQRQSREAAERSAIPI
jgi:hypothetical protein